MYSLTCDEPSSDSYIGRDEFFSFFTKKGRQTSLSKCKSVKVTALVFRFPSKKKYIFPIDPVFSSWVNFLKKLPIINCPRKSKYV